MSEVKKALLQGWRPLTELAREGNYRTVRPLRELAKALDVPILIINRQPHAQPDVLREAMIKRRQVNAAPRGRGRPRKSI
jgi:hypothetical protein